MPALNLDPIQMYYEHHTSTSAPGLPLLMLSGMASDSASWQPAVSALAAHHDLIIPDNRCSGRTLPNPVTTSRELMADDLLRLLDALCIQKVNILGHSMGAMLGWALASKAPDRVNHLISASAQSCVIPARIALFNSLSALRTDQNEPKWFELLYQFLFSPSFFTQATVINQAVDASISYPYKQNAQAFSMQAAALESFLEPPEPETIQCKVSLVTGANDLLMTPAALERFAEKQGYPHSIIDEAAHALHWEQTQKFTDYVLGELG